MCGAGGNIARGALLTLLLAPLVVVLDRLNAVGELTLFVLAAAALIPLSWLIGEATDNLARHTGPGIGGFLNATFGNAPELIIAIIAVSGGLAAIVRASLVGSIASNLLLVLGFTLLVGQTGLHRSPVCLHLARPGRIHHRCRARRRRAKVPRRSGTPLARQALASRCRTAPGRRRDRDPVRAAPPVAALRAAEPEGTGWSLPAALVVLGVATIATAFVSETLVGTLRAFAHAAHLSEFFVAFVIVAIVGNATEHGSAVLLARRGRVKLAVEIPWPRRPDRRLVDTPRGSHLVGLHAACLQLPAGRARRHGPRGCAAGSVLRTGSTTRPGGAMLLAVYSALVIAFYIAGDR